MSAKFHKSFPTLTLMTLVVLTTGVAFPVGAAEFPGIKALMTKPEFRAAGLDGLTDAQLQALDQWLVRYTANEAPVLSLSVEEIQQKQNETITSEIVGEFHGWDGKTRFTLANGQVWQQRQSGRYRYTGDGPVTVEISRNFLGLYKLRVAGTPRRVGVKRLR